MSEGLRLTIDSESYKRLVEIAVSQRRPIGWQAEVMLIKAIAEWYTPALTMDRAEVESAGMREKV
jgi:hypothetical protein